MAYVVDEETWIRGEHDRKLTPRECELLTLSVTLGSRMNPPVTQGSVSFTTSAVVDTYESKWFPQDDCATENVD